MHGRRIKSRTSGGRFMLSPLDHHGDLVCGSVLLGELCKVAQTKVSTQCSQSVPQPLRS